MTAAELEGVQFAELGKGDGGAEIVGEHFGRDVGNGILPPASGGGGGGGEAAFFDAAIAEGAGAGEAGGIAGGEAAGLRGGEVFDGVEAEDADVGEGAAGAAVQGAVDGVGGIFDDGEAEGEDGVHIGGFPGVVDDHDGGGAGGDVRADCVGGDVVGVEIDVGKDGGAAVEENGLGAGDPGEGGEDNFGAGGEIEDLDGEVEGVGAAVDHDEIGELEAGCESMSNSSTFGPAPIHWELRQAEAAAISSSPTAEPKTEIIESPYVAL